MALIQCPKCAQEISEWAKLCPHCQYEIEAEKRKRHLKIFGAILAATVVLITAVALVISLGKPYDVSEQYYQYALRAMEIADQYLDYEITATEASILLDTLTARESELPDTPTRDASFSNDRSIVRTVNSLSRSISLAKYFPTSEDYDNVLEDRNELAEIVGHKKR